VEHEQPEVLAKLAMIALLRLFDPIEVRLQLGLARERGPGNALHRLIVGVPLPIRVRGRQQLEGLEPARGGHVRADTKIDERVAAAGGVARHLRLPGRLLLDQLDLEGLAVLGEELQRLVARPHLPRIRQVACRQLLHLLLDRFEVFRHERPVDHEVVEETFVGRRADPALRPWEQIDHRRRQQVRRAVAVEPECFRTVRGDDADPRTLVQRKGQVDETIIDHCRERSLGKTRRDHGRNVAGGGACGHGTA
jgi:hypothetical protein